MTSQTAIKSIFIPIKLVINNINSTDNCYGDNDVWLNIQINNVFADNTNRNIDKLKSSKSPSSADGIDI